ncbi:MAG TPA: GNAT family N-acetyltransferase [Verrucomicrobiae bacterium]
MLTEKTIAAPKFFPAAAGKSPENFLAEKFLPTNPLQVSDWDSIIIKHPDFSFFHSTAWAKVLSETYGYTPNYFVARENDRLDSLLPVMEVNSWLTGRRGIALPFTDDCEPFCASANSFKKLFQNAVDFGKSRGWKYLECRGGQNFFDGITPSLSFHGHTLNLDGGEEKLFARLENSVRRAIRKAEKDGVTVEIAQDLAAMKIFYSLQCKTRKKHGLPPQPFSFFLNIHRHVLSQNLGMVVLARWQNIPVAASIYFRLGERAIYKYGASDEAFQHLRGSNLVMWEAIKWHLRKGVRKLHFGKTSLANDGLRRFKLGWGAEENKIDYFKYDLHKEKFVGDSDAVSGWHNRLFRLLPGFASRMAGQMLYRHWA